MKAEALLLRSRTRRRDGPGGGLPLPVTGGPISFGTDAVASIPVPIQTVSALGADER